MFRIQAHRFLNLLDDPHLVIIIQNREILLQIDPLSILPQNACSETMKCTDKPSIGRMIYHRLDPLSHLTGCFICEGHGEYFFWPRFASEQQMSQAGRQGSGLARASAGEHQNSTIGRHCRRHLWLVQTI